VQLALVAACSLAGCDRLRSQAEPKPAEADAHAQAKPTEGAKDTHGALAPSANPSAAEAKNFPVPFAWETSRDEPLALARAFVQEMLTDNRAYMTKGAPFFAAFAESQKPRATIVTCSDSRLQSTAYDTTPENDAFTIRNIGNQLGNAEGSVEYGVEHLNSSVLLILGHTGCGAVKAAMAGDLSKLSEPIRHELEHLEVPKPKPGTSEELAWTEAVTFNVHAQVTQALKHFGGRVQAGKLTIVGAIYDFRNELGRGAGKISIVNVNGNEEPSRMQAFIDAVELPAPGKPAARGNSATRPPASNASVRIEQALLDSLREAARIEKPAPRKPAAPAHH
jgi:carbonic anhydrase